MPARLPLCLFMISWRNFMFSSVIIQQSINFAFGEFVVKWYCTTKYQQGDTSFLEYAQTLISNVHQLKEGDLTRPARWRIHKQIAQRGRRVDVLDVQKWKERSNSKSTWRDFGTDFRKRLRYRHFKTAFLQKMSITSKASDRFFSYFANKPETAL